MKRAEITEWPQVITADLYLSSGSEALSPTQLFPQVSPLIKKPEPFFDLFLPSYSPIFLFPVLSKILEIAFICTQ